MKSKFLLAALALPLVFSACTQDELGNTQNDVMTIPDNAIQGLVLNVQKNADSEAPLTRGEWIDAANSIKFSEGDKISMYWLGKDDGIIVGEGDGAQGPNTFKTACERDYLTGKFNSIFHTKDGATFSSESLVFEGGNIAVYPGDLSFVNEGIIYLKVAQNQNATTLANVPYISNQLWIEKQGANQTEQLPGYYGDKELDCPVKLAANVVNLTLNLSNIPAGYDFEVQSVELVGDASTFATQSKVTTSASYAFYEGNVLYNNTNNKVKTIIAQTWSEPSSYVSYLSTSNITKVNDKTVIAHFVVLPTDASTSTGKVIVRTNCGTITLSVDDDEPVKMLNSKGESITIDAAIKAFVTSQTMNDEDSYFNGEKIGKVANRSIAVDASKAKLNGSVVYTSEDIKRYVNLHTDMGSDETTVKLTLAAKSGTIFKGFKKDAADLLKAKNANTQIFSLDKGSISAIEIVGGGDVFDITGAPAVNLQLSNESWSMDDVFTFTSDLNKIVNNGTLTINGTQKNNQPNSIVEAITNNNTINLNGNFVKVGVAEFKSAAGSVINIGANQELQFSNANNQGDLLGTINVNETSSILSTTADVYNNGTINNYGIVAGNESKGWTNGKYTSGNKNYVGTINVKDASAIVYLSNNQTGVVNLMNRNDEVKVDNYPGKIVYNWDVTKASDKNTFTQQTSDKFTYVIFDDVKNLTISTVLSAAPSMEFKGLCTVTANNKTIKDLIIAENADFRFTTGNTLTVTNLTNNGLITIGGDIRYTGSLAGNGRVYTTGSGSIHQ